MMRFVVLAGAVAALAFSGCQVPIGDGNETADDGNDTDDDGMDDGNETGDRRASYVFVWVTGDYEADNQEVGICGYASPPDVDEANETITFHSEGREEVEQDELVNLRGLVLLTQWDSSACGLMFTKVETVWGDGEPNVEVELLGNLTLGMRLNRDDGSVTLYQDETPQENAIQIEAGESHSRSYAGETEDGGTFSANYTLRAMGHWPTTGIILSEDESGMRPV